MKATTTSVTTEIAIDRRNKSHFRTDHLKGNLKARSVRGGAVTLVAQALKFILHIGSTMALARLLTPADFGLVAMVFAFTNFVSMFKDAGLSMATIQRDEINHNQVSVLFWFNITFSVLLMIFMAGLTPAIVWFYKEPRLAWITLATAGTFIFGGLTIQHQALLRRQMRFTVLAGIEIASIITSMATAIAVAFYTRSYWALVVMPAVSSVTNAVLVWVYCDWRPGRPRRGTGVRPLVTFGTNMMAGSILFNLNQDVYKILIGRILGAEVLGYYTKAFTLMLMLIRKFNSPLYSVSFPALSSLQHQPKRFREYYRKAIGTMILFSMPIAVLLIIAADYIVLIILGDKWVECIPVCRALGPGACLGTIGLAITAVIIPLGKPAREWKMKAVSLVFHIFAIFVGLNWGLIGVAIAFSITQLLLFLPNAYYAFYGTPIRLADLGIAVWHGAAASLSAGLLTVLFIRPLLIVSVNLLSGFAIIVISFTLVYIGALLILPGGAQRVKEIVRLVESFKPHSTK